MGSYLRIVFPPPGFFLVDVTVSLSVGGVVVHSGGCMAGFDWCAPAAPGFYTVETCIGGLRRKTFTLGVREGMMTSVTLAYSRLWGNFKETPTAVDFSPS